MELNEWNNNIKNKNTIKVNDIINSKIKYRNVNLSNSANN